MQKPTPPPVQYAMVRAYLYGPGAGCQFKGDRR